MHRWGDDWEYWGDLGKAEGIIYWYARKGFIGGQIKEKFGTLRWYAHISYPEKLHDIVKAGHVFYRWGADTNPIMNVIDNMSYIYMRPFSKLFHYYGRFMYAMAYKRAVAKFPHIYKEILADCDHEKLLFRRERRLYKSLWKDEEE